MKLYRHTATVRPIPIVSIHTSFPMDMLRRDQAYPDGSHDALMISYSLSDELEDDEWATLRIVLLKVSTSKDMDAAWTKERWKSFGWEIVSTEVEDA